MPIRNIHFESGETGNYLVWPLDSQNQLIPYQLEMLIRHRPTYLLPGFLRFRCGQPQLCLETGACLPLDQAIHGKDLNRNRIQVILRELLDDLDDAGDRLLPADHFSLQTDLIFVQPDQKLRLAFWPVRQAPDQSSGTADQPEELVELVKSIGRACLIPDTEIKCWQDQLTAGGLKHLRGFLFGQPPESPGEPVIPGKTPRKSRFRLNLDPGWLRKGLAQVKAGLARGLHIPVVMILLHAACLAGFLLESRFGPAWPTAVKVSFLLLTLALLLLDARQINFAKIGQQARQQAEAIKKSWQEIRQRYFRPATETLDPCGQTIFHFTNPADFRMALLFEGQPGTLEENEGIRAYILVDEFTVGRDQKNSDLYLEDPEIGRQHARILRRAGSFFLCDLGSRNGTSIDGRRLLKNTENLLPDRCLVKFAERQFYFQVD